MANWLVNEIEPNPNEPDRSELDQINIYMETNESLPLRIEMLQHWTLDSSTLLITLSSCILPSCIIYLKFLNVTIQTPFEYNFLFDLIQFCFLFLSLSLSFHSLDLNEQNQILVPFQCCCLKQAIYFESYINIFESLRVSMSTEMSIERFIYKYNTSYMERRENT